jgi:hypothetical protein
MTSIIPKLYDWSSKSLVNYYNSTNDYKDKGNGHSIKSTEVVTNKNRAIDTLDRRGDLSFDNGKLNFVKDAPGTAPTQEQPGGGYFAIVKDNHQIPRQPPNTN